MPRLNKSLLPPIPIPGFSVRQHQLNTDKWVYTTLTLVCDALEKAGFVNGFSTRVGGVSPLPEKSLNFSDKEDSLSNVQENTKRFLDSLGVPEKSIFMLEQIHSDKLVWMSEQTSSLNKKAKADALAGKETNFLLGIKTADCLPLLLADPKTGVFAAIHAGWRGSLARITEKTINWMKQKKNVWPQNLIAAMGPSACGDCFEIGEELTNQFKTEFQKTDQFLFRRKRGGENRYFLDNAQLNREQLFNQGVKKQNIYQLPYCTMHDNSLFFSHRKESNGGKNPVGRMLSVIGLN